MSPRLIVNQARVPDHFARYMDWSPTRMKPDYGWDFHGLEIDESAEYPVAVTLERTAGPDAATQRTVRAKYVVGCDGARSKVRKSIGCTMKGDAANHAWGVMDVLATTTFPDIRAKCIIHSAAGSMLHIPREGGHLFRMYVDLGEQPADGNGEIRKTPIEDIIKGAQAIVHPYDKAWSTLMATKSDALESPDAVEDFYMRTAEFPSGFMTEYPPSLLIGSGAQQELATGFPLDKRFKSSLVERVNDGNPVHLGHKHMADGRWRIYVFADAAAPGTGSATDKLGEWLSTDPRSPLAAQPADGDTDAWFDVKVVYQQPHLDVDINAVPQALKPPTAMRQLGREFDA